jgi:hypothetical protein
MVRVVHISNVILLWSLYILVGVMVLTLAVGVLLLLVHMVRMMLGALGRWLERQHNEDDFVPLRQVGTGLGYGKTRWVELPRHDTAPWHAFDSEEDEK